MWHSFEGDARKLMGTCIGITKHFPEEIEKIWQMLFPGMEKAIHNVEFKPQTSRCMDKLMHNKSILRYFYLYNALVLQSDMYI